MYAKVGRPALSDGIQSSFLAEGLSFPYLRSMEIIETPIFTQAVSSILADSDYKRLQKSIAFRPAAGKLIPKGGGLRKLRWNVGKTEGLRLIYLFGSKPKVVPPVNN